MKDQFQSIIDVQLSTEGNEAKRIHCIRQIRNQPAPPTAVLVKNSVHIPQKRQFTGDIAKDSNTSFQFCHIRGPAFRIPAWRTGIYNLSYSEDHHLESEFGAPAFRISDVERTDKYNPSVLKDRELEYQLGGLAFRIPAC